MSGFKAMTCSYLGEDWEIYGASIDDALAFFANEASTDDLATSIHGFEELLSSSMTDDELDKRWIYGLSAGYDPRADGHTYREWFAHALDVLQREAERRTK